MPGTSLTPAYFHPLGSTLTPGTKDDLPTADHLSFFRSLAKLQPEEANDHRFE